MEEQKEWEGIESLCFDRDDYDLEGLLRLADSQDAALVLTFEDEEDQKHYMNRYERIESYMSIDNVLSSIEDYLEADEANGLFVSFAVVYEGKLKVFNGRSLGKRSLKIGDLELGDHIIYGMLIRFIEDEIVFDKVLYFDGENKSHSWAEVVEDGGELTGLMKSMIEEFSE